MGNQQGKERRQYGRRIDWDNAGMSDEVFFINVCHGSVRLCAEKPPPPGKPYLVPDADEQSDFITIRWAPPVTDGGAPILGRYIR